MGTRFPGCGGAAGCHRQCLGPLAVAVWDIGGLSPLPVPEGQGVSAEQFLGSVGAVPQPLGFPGLPRGSRHPQPCLGPCS